MAEQGAPSPPPPLSSPAELGLPKPAIDGDAGLKVAELALAEAAGGGPISLADELPDDVQALVGASPAEDGGAGTAAPVEALPEPGERQSA